MRRGKVSLGYAYRGELSGSFHLSVSHLLLRDVVKNQRIVNGGAHVAVQAGTGRLVEARNDITAHFLDQTDAEWLWMVDADMAFDPDTLDRLVDAADQTKRPVVGALCFANHLVGETGGFSKRYVCKPTIYLWKANDKAGEEGEPPGGFVTLWDYPRQQLVRCAGTGAACLLIHRRVAERIRERARGDIWWTHIPTNAKPGEVWSEDLSFCLRLAMTDTPLHVHTGVHVWHDKGGRFLSEELFDLERTFYITQREADAGAAGDDETAADLEPADA